MEEQKPVVVEQCVWLGYHEVNGFPDTVAQEASHPRGLIQFVTPF